MRTFKIVSASLAFALAACGQAAAPKDAEAQPTRAPAAPAPAVEAAGAATIDPAAILSAVSLKADASGQVENECGEKVTPKFLPADLGGAVGTATLFVMDGGPNTATCYGDGPDLHLFTKDAKGVRQIYSARGRMLVIMPTTTGGVHDIADGGPGFSFPLWTWNGTEYAFSKRQVSDAETANATFLP